jgi:hypothetical protein
MHGLPGRHALRLGLAALAGVLVVGCSAVLNVQPTSSPSPVATPTTAPRPTFTPAGSERLGDDWTEYTLAEEGFALALPPSWQRVDARSRPPSAPLLASSLRGPAPARVPAAGGSEMPFFALDMASGGDPAGFMTILHQPLSAPATLAEFAAGNVRQLARLPQLASPVDEQFIDLPAGPALRLRYELSLGDSGEEGRLSLTQLLLVHGQEGYVLTFSSLPARLDSYAPVFERISRSFRWLEP